MQKKILIVDDEQDMQIYIETLLRKAGFETYTASNGLEAQEKISTEKPDLITLDIMMPKKSGINFLKFLRENKKTHDIPVAIVSGVTSHKEFFLDIENLGKTIFVDKPIDPASFLSQIKEVLAV
jgi:DNA-binding response OmpR family regulator